MFVVRGVIVGFDVCVVSSSEQALVDLYESAKRDNDTESENTNNGGEDHG